MTSPLQGASKTLPEPERRENRPTKDEAQLAYEARMEQARAEIEARVAAESASHQARAELEVRDLLSEHDSGKKHIDRIFENARLHQEAKEQEAKESGATDKKRIDRLYAEYQARVNGKAGDSPNEGNPK